MIGFVVAKRFCFSIFKLLSNVIKIMLLVPAKYSNTIGVPEFLIIHHIARISNQSIGGASKDRRRSQGNVYKAYDFQERNCGNLDLDLRF
jgi:hypothetical protein